MCGISGWQFTEPETKDFESSAESLLDALDHRGPDARGTYFNQENTVFLGHNRLSIIDLSELGTQPMTSASGDVMVFNGEIYNYKPLKQELQSLGYSFRSDSDSEVLLHCYSEWGTKFTDKITGMYAIAIWSNREKIMHLFRDPTGIKPLYYWKQPNNRGIIFASELRAFCSFKDFKPEVNRTSLNQYIEFGYSFSDDQTIFNNVYKVPPGTRLEIKDGRISSQQQFYTPPRIKKPSDSVQDLEQALFETLDQVVQEHFVADVPVGLLLSGGLDSSLIGALASRHQKIHTFSMGFENAAFDERPFARLVSQHIDSNHTELQISPLEITNDLESVIGHYDDIFADWGMVSTRLLYEKCKDHGIKVVLVGEGSDELFGGYDIFRCSLHGNGSPMEWRIFQLYRRYAGRRYGKQYFNFRQIFKTYLAESNGDMFAAIRLFESRNQLPNNYVMKVDKASMSLGIEARTPFLDARVANLAYQLPGQLLIDMDNEKKVLKSMARRYQLLPDEIIDRRKYGSGIASNWLDEPSEFRDYARETILSQSGWVDDLGLRSAMESYFEQGKSGYRFPNPISIFRNLAWRLLILNLWSNSLGVRA
jgi:asparagine synthase (glutamine-hydrolysing)